MNTKIKKTLKIILWSLLGLLLLFISLILTSPLWLGPAAKSMAESIVPQKTGTAFSVKKMDINIFSGKFLIEGTCLNNPKGYKPQEAAKIGRLFIDLDMPTLFSDVIHIREIAINDVFASYVSNNGTNNFEWISNYAASVSKQEEKEEVKDEKNSKKVIIDRLSFSSSKVLLEILPLPLPEIVLTDIGKKSNGATLAEAGQEIWAYLSKSFSSAGNAVGGFLNTMNKELTSIATEGANMLSGTTNTLNGITKSTTEKASGAVKAVEDVATGAIDAAGKGINEASELIKKASGILKIKQKR